MKPIIRVGLVALVMASAVWSKSQAAESVVGSWRLVSWIEVETESKAAHAAFGDSPMGVITYTSDGRMSLIIADPKRKPATGPKATKPKRQTYIEQWSLTLGLTAWMVTRSPITSKYLGTRHGTAPVNSVLSSQELPTYY